MILVTCTRNHPHSLPIFKDAYEVTCCHLEAGNPLNSSSHQPKEVTIMMFGMENQPISSRSTALCDVRTGPNVMRLFTINTIVLACAPPKKLLIFSIDLFQHELALQCKYFRYLHGTNINEPVQVSWNINTIDDYCVNGKRLGL